ncbi:MAG: hypothetical protein ABSG43_29200, partial [Solirubrobacteraceae bacterium]
MLTTHYMDEAQHLADRVAIIRAGEIIAQGGPQEIGRDETSQSVISFQMPHGVAPETIATIVGAPCQVTAAVASLRVTAAQQALLRLTTWAEHQRVQLAGIEVRQPTLEGRVHRAHRRAAPAG